MNGVTEEQEDEPFKEPSINKHFTSAIRTSDVSEQSSRADHTVVQDLFNTDCATFAYMQA